MKAETYLMHHGIKGMKWGVRRERDSSGGGRRSSSRQEKTGKIEAKPKKQSRRQKMKAMSDDELRAAIKRLELEKQYEMLAKNDITSGQRYITKFVDQNANAILGGAAAVIGSQVGKAVVDYAKKRMERG